MKDRGLVSVKGREEPVRVYEVIGLDPVAGPGGSNRMTMTRGARPSRARSFWRWAAFAWAADPVGVLTEIRAERGQVEVKRAGETQWTAAQPLLALRPGDQLRVTGEARAALVFTGGRGAQAVSAGNSPFTVQAARRGRRRRQGEGSRRQRHRFPRRASRRISPTCRCRCAASVRPASLSWSRAPPRCCRAPSRFEWSGSDTLRYKVRVLGPQGLLWEQADLPRKPVAYPASAPALEPGVRYTWQLETAGQPMQQAEFEILPAAEAARVRESLDTLVPASLPGYPPSSIALMRAGYELRDGLYADARRELLTALASDPDEPTLHFLLGQVYDTIGLGELAQREFIEARDLTNRR